MEALSFTQIIIIIISLFLGIIAVKIAINFDINKYLERKDKLLDQKIKNTCLHMELSYDEQQKGVIYKSFFVSPSGTLQWQCQRCGFICNHIDQDDQYKTAQYYLNNSKEYKKQQGKFYKLLKKKGIV